MSSTSPRRAAPSMRMEAGFSQLRFPFQAEVGRNGLFLKNSTFTDGLRRLVTKRLPQGAPERIAERLGRRVEMVYHEHEGETKYSLDVFAAGLIELPRHEARHVLRQIARTFGALVIEDPSLDDSAVGS